MTPIQTKLHDRIVVDPQIAFGKPIVEGTRLSVEFIIGLLASGWSRHDILENYPHINNEDISACLSYAQRLVSEEQVFAAAE